MHHLPKNNTFLVLFSSSVWLLLFLIYTFFYLSTGASVTALTLLNIINHSQIFHTFKNIHCCSLLQGCNCLEYTIFEAILKNGKKRGENLKSMICKSLYITFRVVHRQCITNWNWENEAPNVFQLIVWEVLFCCLTSCPHSLSLSVELFPIPAFEKLRFCRMFLSPLNLMSWEMFSQVC